MSNDLFFTISARSPRAAFAVNPDSGQWVYANQAFLNLVGKQFEELSAPLLAELIHPADLDYLKTKYAGFLANTDPGDVEFRIRNSSGRDTWIRLTPFLLQREDTRLLGGLIADISAEVSNLENLKKFANKKNSILQILAHDLIGPLGIARTITTILEKQATEPEVTSRLNMISRITSQAILMIRDLTTREFLETSQVELVKKRIDLVQKLREYMEECSKSEAYTRRSFLFTASASQIFLNVDEPKFFQVINNLLTNSLKFTREGDTISIALEELEDRVRLAFSDTGIGIPADLQPGIFEKFNTAGRTGLLGEPTVGLGLSIVRTIIEWHHGSIRVESTENAGTTFHIEFPKEA